MASIEVEMRYFKNDVKMSIGTDVKVDKVKEIGTNCGTDVTVKDGSGGGVSWVTLKMASDDESALRRCVKEIVQMYGKPDFPMILFGSSSKKKGKELTISVLNELGIK